MESDILTARITFTTMSGLKKRDRCPITDDFSFDLLCQHARDGFAKAWGLAVGSFKVEFIEIDTVPCMVQSDLVLRECLRDYFAKAAGGKIDLHFLVDETPGPEQKFPVPSEETKHTPIVSAKPEVDLSLFNFDTIDGPSFPVTSIGSLTHAEVQEEFTAMRAEAGSIEVTDKKHFLGGESMAGPFTPSTPPSQSDLPSLSMQDLQSDTPSQSGVSLYSPAQDDNGADSTVRSDVSSQDTTGNISDLESQAASSSVRAESTPKLKSPAKLKSEKVEKQVRKKKVKKLGERYTVRKTPKHSSQKDKKVSQTTPSKIATSGMATLGKTPVNKKKESPKKGETPRKKVVSVTKGSSKKPSPKKSSGKKNSLMDELAKAQILEKRDYKLPEGYDGMKWVTEVSPRRVPYFPQVGDVVKYYKDIHERFQQCISHVSFVSPKVKRLMYQPFNKKRKMRIKKVETMKVLKVEFEIVSKVDQTRLVIVHLEREECEDPEKENVTIYLQEMPEEVPQEAEFLVLKQFVDKAEAEYEEKGREEYLKKRAKILFCENNRLKWANGRIELMGDPKKKSQPVTFLWDLLPGQALPEEDGASLWEIFLYEDGAEEVEHDSALTDAELLETSYQPEPEDWPGGSKAFISRMLRIVRSLRGKAIVLGLPASLKEEKWRFGQDVPYPMTLELMEERLKHSYYRRKAALDADVKHLQKTINLESNMKDSTKTLDEVKLKTRIVCDVLMEGINSSKFDEANVGELIGRKQTALCKDHGEAASKKRPRPDSGQSEGGPGTSSAAKDSEGPAAKKSRSGREIKNVSAVHQSLGSFV